MNNFWTLVGFEYKKVFSRKSTIIACILAFVVIVFTGFSLLIGIDPSTGRSKMEEMKIDKEYEIALSGKELDTELILKAADAYSQIPDDVYPFNMSEEYQLIARPYNKIRDMIDASYTNRNNSFGYKELSQLTFEQADIFYHQRLAQYKLNLENNPMFSERNIDRVMQSDRDVTKPIVIEYSNGYLRFFDLSSITALVTAFLLSFISAPMFADEHQKRTDSLILSSKNGKSVSTIAKIFVGISLGIMIAVVALIACYLSCMLTYGFNGTTASIQNYQVPITYNFALFECVILLFVTTIFSSFLTIAIGLCLSSITKKIFIALAISIIIPMLSMFGGQSLVWFELLKMFLPVGMGTFKSVITQLSWNIFGLDVWLYQAVCIISCVVSGLLLILTYHSFKRHQVG